MASEQVFLEQVISYNLSSFLKKHNCSCQKKSPSRSFSIWQKCGSLSENFWALIAHSLYEKLSVNSRRWDCNS